MGEQGLYKPEDPLKEAMARGDYILVPGPPGAETAARATALSKYISDVMISGARGSLMDKPLYDRQD
jgi:predicted PilT family ATPase